MTTTIYRVMLVGGIVAVAGMSAARADFLPRFFVDVPDRDSQNWSGAVATEGGKINSDVDFRAMSTGPLKSDFYNGPAHPDGVRLVTFGSTFNDVVDDGGPNQALKSGQVSSGEGQFSGGNYLRSDSPGATGGSSLLIQFSKPVMAVGLSTIDYFGSDTTLYNGGLTNTLTLSVYSVQGLLMGSATAARYDFQPNNIYFMGFVTTSDSIGSAVFSRGPDRDSDAIGITGIDFANAVAAVPEPSGLVLATIGATAVVAWSARRRRRAG